MNPISPENIFNTHTPLEFDQMALKIFHYQAKNNPVYNTFLQRLEKDPDRITKTDDIPFLPVEFFKSTTLLTGPGKIKEKFFSSGTTGRKRSTHFLYDTELYKKSFTAGFKHFYGDIKDYCILALLPGYLDQEGSSLVYMMKDLIRQTEHPDSGFHHDDFQKLGNLLEKRKGNHRKIILFGVSFALMDFADYYDADLKNTLVMETGGMKGRRREITRTELHNYLCRKLGVDIIHSEYGMTELLSQAYSKGNGIYRSPPWMKILIRDPYDPFHYLPHGKTGGINIIDLANLHSVSFIETQDLGRFTGSDSFEILGRYDHSDIRGCNLLIQD